MRLPYDLRPQLLEDTVTLRLLIAVTTVIYYDIHMTTDTNCLMCLAGHLMVSMFQDMVIYQRTDVVECHIEGRSFGLRASFVDTSSNYRLNIIYKDNYSSMTIFIQI